MANAADSAVKVVKLRIERIELSPCPIILFISAA
jgi:hypothetical protein